MKSSFVFILAALSLLAGCSKNIITIMGKETHKNIFQEISEERQVPAGYAELIIVSSLKTIKPGIYPFESKVRGTPDYVLLINIDGQATLAKGSLKEENSDPRWPKDPEAGEGIRYQYQKNLLLKAGHHKVFIAIPEDRVAIKRELNLKEGTTNILKLEPTYKSKKPGGEPGLGMFSSSSFDQGIDGFFVSLNDEPI